MASDRNVQARPRPQVTGSPILPRLTKLPQRAPRQRWVRPVSSDTRKGQYPDAWQRAWRLATAQQGKPGTADKWPAGRTVEPNGAQVGNLGRVAEQHCWRDEPQVVTVACGVWGEDLIAI